MIFDYSTVDGVSSLGATEKDLGFIPIAGLNRLERAKAWMCAVLAGDVAAQLTDKELEAVVQW
jgi:hypothetical protein